MTSREISSALTTVNANKNMTLWCYRGTKGSESIIRPKCYRLFIRWISLIIFNGASFKSLSGLNDTRPFPRVFLDIFKIL